MNKDSKRVTIKDIAQEADVSIATVHCALYNKPGVSTVVKDKILKIAHDNNYKININASILKRKTFRIAAVIPSPIGENRFYYKEIWSAIYDYMKDLNDFCIDLIEVAYEPEKEGAYQAYTRTVKGSHVDCLLISADTDADYLDSLKSFSEQNIPLGLIGTDYKKVNRLFCIQPHFLLLGKMITELLVSQMKDKKTILVCAGREDTASHYLIVHGMYEYLKENNLDQKIIPVYNGAFHESICEKLVSSLNENSDIGGCVSVNARSSVQLAEALVASKMAGKIPAIGSDIFEENINALKNGIFSNLINKNPYSQVMNGLTLMVDYLAKDILNTNDVMYIRSDLIFRSTLPLYENNDYRLLL